MRVLSTRLARVLSRGLLCGPVIGVAVSAGPAAADSLTDQIGPREVAVGEALRGGAVGGAGVDLNPAGMALNRELVFEGGYGYRGADSASLVGVSACDSTNAVPGCFFYNYAGASVTADSMPTAHRTTHVGGVALSRVLVPRILIGVTAKYYHHATDVAGETGASGTTFDLGALVRLADTINVGVSAQNLWASTAIAAFPRAVGGGVYAHPLPMLAVSFDARWRLDGPSATARYGGGGELFLRGDGGQSGIPLRVGALHDDGLGATYVSAGLGYASLAWGVDVAARREIRGGSESMVIASMRLFGPRLPAPSTNEL